MKCVIARPDPLNFSDDKELRFFRVDVLEKGVKYKLLTLRGDLTFWLKKDGDRCLITNINRIRVTNDNSL